MTPRTQTRAHGSSASQQTSCATTAAAKRDGCGPTPVSTAPLTRMATSAELRHDSTRSRAGPAIAEALTDLSAGDRDVLLLFAWADLRYEEIAVALRIPVGTVRSRLHRARRRVRELLGESGQYLGAEPLTEAPESNG
jgi:RNA polymerase sigma factor (sigma-70 family)